MSVLWVTFSDAALTTDEPARGPLTRFVESTITFPYKRSLGPVVGAFMTALTEKQILGIRCQDAVLVPPMEWDPATGAELPARVRGGGAGGHGRVVDVGGDALGAAPARPSLRLCAGPP